MPVVVQIPQPGSQNFFPLHFVTPPLHAYQRKSRLANEAAEIRKQLSRGSDMEREALAHSALEGAFESVLEALLRSAVAGAEMMEMREVKG